MGADPKKLVNRALELHEFNPMLGFRGCRLAIAYPGDRGNAGARHLRGSGGDWPHVRRARRAGDLVPLIASKAEFDLVKERIDATAETVASETKSKIKYQVGTMIELPRAALQAGEIAETAEFFSFGTNDLTQTTFGISRDDAASFLGIYTSKGILAIDPFVSIDRAGVGELGRIATERGRKVRPKLKLGICGEHRPKLKLGICGEHSGDPASVSFCREVGLDYVSCSPFRVPIARLAAAQAASGRRRCSVRFGRRQKRLMTIDGPH
jgi:pyruvate,orthophosphate dikinase